MKIVVVDYGMGNIKSIKSVFKYHGVDDLTVSNSYDDIKSADKLLLPGVGSFAKAMEKIKQLGIDKYLEEAVIGDLKPILGICLGMQLMTMSSEEDGFTEGLSYVEAKCEKLDQRTLRLPHVGFNQVKKNKGAKLFDEIEDMSDFYFTHSYAVQSTKNINQSICNYGQDFIAGFERDNITGVQFHPELSQTNGLKLIQNFLEKF